MRAHHAVRGAYLAALARRFHALRGKRVALICKDRFLRALARDALRLAGHEVSSDAEITFSLTESQARVLPRERMLTEEEQWLLCSPGAEPAWRRGVRYAGLRPARAAALR